jgi:glucokinase
MMSGNDDGQLGGVTVGVDVGGSTITAVVVDTALHARAQLTRATDKSSPRRTIDSIAATVTEALEMAQTPLAQVSAIGMGVPGKVDTATGMVNLAVNLNWDEMPAGSLFSELFGVPCYLENDLRLAALGYYRFFTKQSIQNMAYVSVGTGLAAGLILDGRLHRGSNGMAGEIGHMVIDPDGPVCNCGNRGCLEMYTAGPAYARAGEAAVTQGRLEYLRGKEEVTAVDIFHAAEMGETAAQEIIDSIGATLGRGLQTLIAAYDVDKIILGGGVARAGDIFLQSIRREWQRQAGLSPLAADMLQPEKLECAPAERNAGAWGGVALAISKRPLIPSVEGGDWETERLRD